MRCDFRRKFLLLVCTSIDRDWAAYYGYARSLTTPRTTIILLLIIIITGTQQPKPRYNDGYYNTNLAKGRLTRRSDRTTITTTILITIIIIIRIIIDLKWVTCCLRWQFAVIAVQFDFGRFADTTPERWPTPVNTVYFILLNSLGAAFRARK